MAFYFNNIRGTVVSWIFYHQKTFIKEHLTRRAWHFSAGDTITGHVGCSSTSSYLFFIAHIYRSRDYIVLKEK